MKNTFSKSQWLLQAHFLKVLQINWEKWSPEKEELLLSEGRAVFIEFTARWCASCQINKRVYEIESIIENELICTIRVKAGNRQIASGRTGQKILSKIKINQIFTSLER